MLGLPVAHEHARICYVQVKPRRVFRTAAHRQLTQAELLAEAARTEIENTKSLQLLVAIEEEHKKKSQVGPPAVVRRGGTSQRLMSCPMPMATPTGTWAGSGTPQPPVQIRCTPAAVTRVQRFTPP